MWKFWSSNRELSEQEYQQARQHLVEKAPIPVLWLFGKTGSGKSSIVRYLTGAESVEIGRGFKPQTRFSSIYAFPDETEPVLKFLDTRGIGEAGYDPQKDIEQFDETAHLMIITLRAMDHAVEDLFDAVKQIRKAAPTRPVVLALTALHDAYPGENHPPGDPFDSSPTPLPSVINDNLRRSLELHYERFNGLFDRAIPIDLTPVSEGFEQPHFGGERLKQGIIEELPAAYRHNMLQVSEVVDPLADHLRRKTMPIILGSSSLAATAAAVPVPWVDIPVVMGIQTHLIYKLAKIHRQRIDNATIAKISGVLGGRVAVSMAIRESLKFIPWVGMAANAAASFGMTYATGTVWNWYFTEVSKGHLPSEEELRQVYHEQLIRAAELWKTTRAS